MANTHNFFRLKKADCWGASAIGRQGSVVDYGNCSASLNKAIRNAAEGSRWEPETHQHLVSELWMTNSGTEVYAGMSANSPSDQSKLTSHLPCGAVLSVPVDKTCWAAAYRGVVGLVDS